MTVTSYPLLYNAAYQIGRYIAANPKKTYQMARAVYNALPTIHREKNGFLKPRAKTTTTTTARKSYTAPATTVKYRYAKRPYHYRRRKLKKTARIARRQAGRVKKNNIYNRRKKNMRLYNKGILALQQRLQSGGQLPHQTFARMFWRGSNTCYFTVADIVGTPSAFTIGHVNRRSFCLNQLARSPNLDAQVNTSTSTGFNHLVTYANIWRTLYEEYQVRGAKIKIKISPNFYPSVIGTISPVTSQDNHVPLNAQPGYWYIRVYYNRAADSSATTYDSVGKPIVASVSTSIDDKTENWNNLREFLSDPTVTYRRDTTQIRTKLHLHTDNTDIGDAAISSTQLPNNAGATYEIEKSNKSVYLSTVFSARKHFMDKNVNRNQPWFTWNDQLPDHNQFNIRFGYIGFDSTGQVAYHTPLDRDFKRFVEVEIDYFVALRKPRIDPHDKFLPVESAGKFIADNIEEEDNIEGLEEDAFSDLEEEFDPEPYEEPPEEMMALLDL